MKIALSLTLLLSVFAGASVLGQRRTVTNADLERHRQKRLQAEQDYRDNYEKMGFPSPEELQRQIEQGRTERFALAERLAQERLERERIAIERERLDIERESVAIQRRAMEAAYASPVSALDDGYYGLGFPNHFYFGGPSRGFPRSRFGREQVNIGNGIPLVNYYGAPGIGGRILRTPRAPRPIFGSPRR